MTITQEVPLAALSDEECWELLELDEFGRLAYRLVDEMRHVPINYVAEGGRLLFRTASGNALLAAALHSDVALEVDWHSESGACSVVVRGRLRRLREDEASHVKGRLLEPWIPRLKSEVLELEPVSVSGRRCLLCRPESRDQIDFVRRTRHVGREAAQGAGGHRVRRV